MRCLVPQNHFQCQVQWLRMQKPCSLNNHKHFYFIISYFFLFSHKQTLSHLLGSYLKYFFNSFRLVFFFYVNRHWQRFLRFRVFQSSQLLCQKLDFPYQWTNFLELNEKQFLDCYRILLTWLALLEIDAQNIAYWLLMDERVDSLANEITEFEYVTFRDTLKICINLQFLGRWHVSRHSIGMRTTMRLFSTFYNILN